MNLSKSTKWTKVNNYATAATSAIESTVIDMLGYDGVLFVTTIAVANAGNHIKVQSGTDGAVSDAADLTGTKVICTSANECVGVDVYRPLERYLRAYVTRTASSACGEIYAIQYCGSKLPIDNTTAGTLNIELHVSPAEGTA